MAKAIAVVALDHLLEGRHHAVARLAGYADAANRAVGDHREANEAAAIVRARLLAGTALGTGLFARLQAEGETLADAQISALAFGAADSADFSLAATQRRQACRAVLAADCAGLSFGRFALNSGAAAPASAVNSALGKPSPCGPSHNPKASTTPS